MAVVVAAAAGEAKMEKLEFIRRRWPCGADGVISTVQLLPGRNAAERR